ncbi:MAG: hypothetical protein AAF567_03535 [Actinomycetota bacterium]
MTRNDRSLARRLLVVVAALAIFATACGGGGGDPDVIAAGEANVDALAVSNDFAASELLEVSTGEITTLNDVATGDRAVLAWYWAPH